VSPKGDQVRESWPGRRN